MLIWKLSLSLQVLPVQLALVRPPQPVDNSSGSFLGALCEVVLLAFYGDTLVYGLHLVDLKYRIGCLLMCTRYEGIHLQWGKGPAG